MANEDGEIKTKLCPSCKQDVPVQNFEMHSIHCKRFLVPCPHCGDSVNKNDLEEHIEENHVKVQCDVCQESVEKMDLDQHKISRCKKRKVNCKYCEISLLALEIEEHQEACGSRTEECEICKRRILVKDLEQHALSGCKHPPLINGSVKRNIAERSKSPERVFDDTIYSPYFSSGFQPHPRILESATYSNNTYDNPYFSSANDEKVVSDFESSNQMKSTIKERTRANRSPVFRPEASWYQGNRSLHDTTYSVASEAHSTKTEDAWNRYSDHQVERCGFSSSDSDSDENPVRPDLTDDTMLPCEFCHELFPADSLILHQPMCDLVSETPRPPSPPKLKRLSLEPFQYSTSAHGELQENSDHFFEQTSPGLDENFAPCEFCSESIVLAYLAMHQVTCPENPNVQRYPHANQALSMNHTLLDVQRPPATGRTLVSHENARSREFQALDASELLRSAPTNENQEEKTTSSSTAPGKQRNPQKRMLAANFHSQRSPLPTNGLVETSSFANSDQHEKPTTKSESKAPFRRHTKQSPRKPISKVNNFPQRFREVNVLGGESRENTSLYTSEFPQNSSFSDSHVDRRFHSKSFGQSFTFGDSSVNNTSSLHGAATRTRSFHSLRGQTITAGNPSVSGTFQHITATQSQSFRFSRRQSFTSGGAPFMSMRYNERSRQPFSPSYVSPQNRPCNVDSNGQLQVIRNPRPRFSARGGSLHRSRRQNNRPRFNSGRDGLSKQQHRMHPPNSN